MNDVVVDEILFIEEKKYKEIKEKLNKSNDYFTEKEFEKIRRNLGVIYI